MNIVVKPYDSDLCYCRPDTTWERENRDFYSPECVNEIKWTPVVFARVSKAGKCIGKKFSQRYYDGIGCGMLMYCRIQDQQLTSCVDHTSILPMPLYDPIILEGGKVLEVTRDGEVFSVISSEKNGWRQMLEDAICESSRLISLRIGDFVAVELSQSAPLARAEDREVSIKGRFCENDIFDFKIVF